MSLSLNSIFDPLNDFFLKKYGSGGESPVMFRFDRFGSAISQEDFLDPADPAGGYSAALARERLSDLVNRIPVDAGDGMHVTLTSGSIDEFYYSRLLTRAAPFLAPGTPRSTGVSIVDGLNQLRALALQVWESATLTSLSGSPLPFRPTEAQPAAWYDPARQGGWAKASFTIDAAKPPTTGGDSLPPPEHVEPLAWKVMPTEAELQPVLRSKAAQAVSERLSMPAAKLDLAGGLRPLAGFRSLAERDPVPDVGVLKSQLRSADKLRDNMVVLDAVRRIQVKELVEKVATEAPVATDKVTISFEYCLVNLDRKWLSTTFLYGHDWKVPGVERGALSRPAPQGTLSLLPIGLVLVRNLEIKANWSAEDKANLVGAMSVGPFDVSASLGTGALSQPGIQVVGWLVQHLPELPPNPDTPSDVPAEPDEPDVADEEDRQEEPKDEPKEEPKKERPQRPTLPAVHTVRRGDTLSKIAKKYYGDKKAWPAIAAANNIADANQISVGQRLTIPVRPPADQEPSGPAAPDVVTTPEPATEPLTPAVHTVARGDTLSKIALRYYGKKGAWPRIARANNLPDPDALRVGQKLTIP